MREVLLVLLLVRRTWDHRGHPRGASSKGHRGYVWQPVRARVRSRWLHPQFKGPNGSWERSTACSQIHRSMKNDGRELRGDSDAACTLSSGRERWILRNGFGRWTSQTRARVKMNAVIELKPRRQRSYSSPD